jgi:hypothetical protein
MFNEMTADEARRAGDGDPTGHNAFS